jgi:hypothetical protein
MQVANSAVNVQGQIRRMAKEMGISRKQTQITLIK